MLVRPDTVMFEVQGHRSKFQITERKMLLKWSVRPRGGLSTVKTLYRTLPTPTLRLRLTCHKKTSSQTEVVVHT